MKHSTGGRPNAAQRPDFTWKMLGFPFVATRRHNASDSGCSGDGGTGWNTGSDHLPHLHYSALHQFCMRAVLAYRRSALRTAAPSLAPCTPRNPHVIVLYWVRSRGDRVVCVGMGLEHG